MASWFLPDRHASDDRARAEGFTLLETVVALALIVSTAIGPLTLAVRGITTVRYSRNRLVALNLGQEGLEIIRWMRETNISKGYTWRCLAESPRPSDCTALAAGSYQVDIATPAGGSPPPGNNPSPLYFFDDGTQAYYSNSGASGATPFTRVVRVDDVVGQPDQMLLTSTVTWNEGDVPQSVVLKEILYNWQ